MNEVTPAAAVNQTIADWLPEPGEAEWRSYHRWRQVWDASPGVLMTPKMNKLILTRLAGYDGPGIMPQAFTGDKRDLIPEEAAGTIAGEMAALQAEIVREQQERRRQHGPAADPWQPHLRWVRQEFGGALFRTGDIQVVALTRPDWTPPPRMAEWGDWNPEDRSFVLRLGQAYGTVAASAPTGDLRLRAAGRPGGKRTWCVVSPEDQPNGGPGAA